MTNSNTQRTQAELLAKMTFGNKQLQQDDVFTQNSMVDLKTLTGMESRKGLEKAIICGDKIVNVVSDGYGHLPNETFFGEVERKLNDADVKYVKRSINRDNRSFAVDYILADDRYVIKVKNDMDEMLPLLRFVNSYDGSCKTQGQFGVYRKVCSNGMFGTRFDIGFSVKHRGSIVEVVMPNIETLVNKFMENEYYSLSRKFEVLAERYITDLNGFVKATADKLKLFKFEKSEKNPLPSLNARMVLDIIAKEANTLGTLPTFWNGYNAMNEVLHTKLKKSFEQQAKIDTVLFDTVMEMATA